MNELNCRLESLEAFLNVEWSECPSDDCFMGKQISSYSSYSPCPQCKGVGKVHKKIKQVRKRRAK